MGLGQPEGPQNRAQNRLRSGLLAGPWLGLGCPRYRGLLGIYIESRAYPAGWLAEVVAGCWRPVLLGACWEPVLSLYWA